MHISTWLVSAMVAWIPPRPADQARYEAMAADFVTVATEAPVFDGEGGAARTALLLAAVASYESTFRADVDVFTTKGDNGKSWGLLQVKLRPGEACSDRLSCLRIGRERMRESFKVCKALPLEDRLSAYTRGKCASDAASRYRMYRALSYWKKHPHLPDG